MRNNGADDIGYINFIKKLYSRVKVFHVELNWT